MKTMKDFKQMCEDVMKEIKKGENKSGWSLEVSSMDIENGDEYEVWSQFFEKEESLKDCLNENPEWEKEKDKYNVEKRFIPKILGSEVPELRAKQQTLKQCGEEQLEFLEELKDVCFNCEDCGKCKGLLLEVVERIESIKKGLEELEKEPFSQTQISKRDCAPSAKQIREASGKTRVE